MGTVLLAYNQKLIQSQMLGIEGILFTPFFLIPTQPFIIWKLEKPTLGSKISAFPAHSSVGPGTLEPFMKVPKLGGEERDFLLLHFFYLYRSFILHWWKVQKAWDLNPERCRKHSQYRCNVEVFWAERKSSQPSWE